MKRLACALAVALTSFACRSAPSDAEKAGSGASSVPSVQAQDDNATAERCGPGFWGQMMKPQGETLQRETAQTKPCPGDECGMRTLHMLGDRYSSGDTCDEIRKNIKDAPVMDAWGAQVRVVCNGVGAQAISAGHDGKIGTCDDLSGRFSMGMVEFDRLQKSTAGEASEETCGPRFRGKMIAPPRQIVQRQTAQTKTCPGEDCVRLTFGFMAARYRSGDTCGEVRESMKTKPLRDAWGAKVRVICNGVNAQAISAGRDGKIGTCDDLATELSMGKVASTRLRNTAAGGGSPSK
jgi:hypothetical protein